MKIKPNTHYTITPSGRTPSEPELQNLPVPRDGNCSCGHHEEAES